MATVTKPIALDESLNTTELSSRNVADVLAQELSAVATAIGGIAVPSADHVSYDNSVSGLSATDVQNALDEIVSDIPTVNNGTLTIQQNGTSIGSFSANTASNVTANIKTPTADKKTATTEFDTANGGLLSKCQINLVPVQSGSGDPSPDNVRPISGHTEVDLDVKDGDNVTQHTYQVQIGSTVYGGTFKAVEGEPIEVDNNIQFYEFDGTEAWVVGTSNTYGQLYYLTDTAPRYNNTITELCNWLGKSDNRSTSNPNGTKTGYSPGGNALYLYFFVRFDLCADLNAWKTFLSNNPLQVAYRVADSYANHIILAKHLFEALVGQNNLSTPLSGQSIETNGVEYKELFTFDDVEKVVSLRVPISMLGTDESGRTTASQSYASGDYFYKDGYMCKALTSISAGATLTLNTNYSQGTLADILKAIENA